MAEKAILVGDHRQLPPLFGEHAVTYYDYIQDIDDDDQETKNLLSPSNYDRFEELVTNSLFKRHYEQANPANKGPLLKQYRMHREIMDVVNMFYDNKLEPGISEEEEILRKAHHVIIRSYQGGVSLVSPDHHAYWIDSSSLHGTPAYETQAKGSSKYNRLEAVLIANMVQQIDDSYRAAEITNKVEIGIISFYAAQVREIRQEIAKKCKLTCVSCDVNTVDRFQGKEKPIVIVSLVRNVKAGKKYDATYVKAYQRIQQQMIPVKQLLLKKETFAQKITVLQRIDDSCRNIRIALPDYGLVLDDLVGAIDFVSADSVIDDLMIAYANLFKVRNDQLYADLVVKAAAMYGFRTGIWDLHKILVCVLQSIDININDFMQQVDAKVFPSIPETELDSLFDDFADTVPEQIPEISVISKSYNNLIKQMKLISGLLHGIEWHGEINRDAMLNGIINCSVLPKVQQTVYSIRDIIQDLQSKGCSVFDKNGTCRGISRRLDTLEQILSCFVYPDGEIATVYLIDTCAFLHSPDILSFFEADEMVRIPFTVLRELDQHKDNNPDLTLKKCAAFACKQIESRTLAAERNHDDHFAVEPCDYPEILPDGFSAHKHDDLILSAALRYKLLNPRILTDDTNFRNIARTQGIDPIAWDKFITDRGGNAVRGQGDQTVDNSSIKKDNKSISATSTLAPLPEEKQVEAPATMSVEQL